MCVKDALGWRKWAWMVRSAVRDAPGLDAVRYPSGDGEYVVSYVS